MSFHEVALVEPGENGAAPGTPEFNDFVVVQGSTDGITWTNLVDEYDAAEHADWLAAGTQGNKELYKLRTIDLQSTFQANEEILIRFVLRSNATIESWGWAIDNLRIQTDNVVTGIEQEKKVWQYQVYPNPVTDNAINIVRANNPLSGAAVFYNLQGQQVLWQNLGVMANETVTLPASLQDGLYTVIITSGNRAEAHKILLQRDQ